MTVIKLRHIDRFRDRHGKLRHFFRRGKGVRVPLPGVPGSSEFMSAYNAALQGERPVGGSLVDRRSPPGTISRLVDDYFGSPEFLALKASTQRAYRGVIERWVHDEKIGHRLVRELRREHVSKMMAKRSKTPGAANDLLKKIRLLMSFAIVNDFRRDDPTLKMRRFKSGEFHTWVEDEIATFEEAWPVGSRQRLAFALHLFTGQRVSDVSHMNDDDIGAGRISVTQIKTGEKLTIPLHPVLATILAATPTTPGALLKTSFGKPFTEKGLANFMADAIGASGVPDHCVTHGLRKAAARRLAEAGCTVHEIMAITGHKTLKEVERYTKAAGQQRLAQAAIDRLPIRLAGTTFPNQLDGLGNAAENLSNISASDGGWRARQDSNLRPLA